MRRDARGRQGRAFREVASVEAAHARGEQDEDGWHRAMAAIIAPSYLNATDLRADPGTRAPPSSVTPRC